MKEFIESIRKALSDENYQAALFLSLSIPDICGKLETPNVRNGMRAKRWFKENMKSKYFPDTVYESMLARNPTMSFPEHLINRLKEEKPSIIFTDDHYWALRNAFLHEASDITKFHKIHLTHSAANLNMFDGAIQLSVISFSQDICQALELWLERIKGDSDVMERVDATSKIKNEINGIIRFG